MKKIFLLTLIMSLSFTLCACNRSSDDYIADESTLEEIWNSNKEGYVLDNNNACVMSISSDEYNVGTLYIDKDSHIYIGDYYYQYSYGDKDIVYLLDSCEYDAVMLSNPIDFRNTYLAVSPNNNEEILSSLVKKDIVEIKTTIDNDEENKTIERTYTYNKKDKKLINVFEKTINERGTNSLAYSFWYGNEEDINDDKTNDTYFENLYDAIEKEKSIPEDIDVRKVLDE